MRRLASMFVAGVAILVFAASCQRDGRSDLAGPTGAAHIPQFSQSSMTPSGATFTTDKDDYLPGETVNVSGSGWQPSDVLDIHLTVDPETHAAVDWSVTVGDDGSFTDGSYVVQDADLGATLTITATSRATGETATASFTDGAPVPQSPVYWNSAGGGTTGGVCNSFEDDAKLTPGPGQQGWLFILTNDDPAHNTSDLTATFSDGSQGPIAGDKQANGSYHYIVYTTLGATLLSAEATNGMSNSQLTVSHCESGGDGGGGGEADAPGISKDAAGAYDNTYAWTIDKAVDKTIVKQIGGSATFNYTVTVSHDDGTISNVKVSGTITVNNPNADPIDIDAVTDVLSDGTICTVTGGGPQSLATGDHDFAYECDLGVTLPSGDVTNKATVAWSEQTLAGGDHLGAGSSDFTSGTVSFTETKIDECIDVSDSHAGALGTVCVGEANPTTFTYSRTITVPTYGCVSYDNTATFTTNDTGTTDSDDQSVMVCGPIKTGALTIGFWQNKNGQGIIKAGAATSGVCNSGTWLRQYAPFQDLSATATCNQVATYVTNVIKAANASGSSMNAMLKAQMLATALDVYFSDPALGGNMINAPAPIGGVSIDLTLICTDLTCITFEDASSVFGGSPKTVLEMLAYAASQSNVGGSTWYGNVKPTQELAKDAFDAINNEKVFAP